MRLCQGYINNKLADTDKIRLPPKLYSQFKHALDGKLSVQPLKHDVLNTLNRSINDFRGGEILIVALSVRFQLMQVIKSQDSILDGSLNLTSTDLNSEDLLVYLAKNP